MLTEHISPRFVDLDSWSTGDMIHAMYDGQLVACAAVKPALPAINAAVDDAVSALKRGGRLVYVGAGTSGRIAIQDGAEPFEAQVREATGDERTVWWERAVAAYPSYADYQRRTDRQIPVFVATRKA